jgi:penicillin amidase/acyl-homoserine-lactone acylase
MILRSILVLVIFAVLAFFSFFGAHETRLTWFDAKAAIAAAAKYDSTIVRDSFGVPHISGRRDTDVAFGLAYAHAEDDFQTLQRALLAARGRLANVDGIGAAESDYIVQLLGTWNAIGERYQSDLSDETRALLDGYAAGFNLYAAQHRSTLLPGVAPVKGQDIVALFMVRLPFFYGLDEQLHALLAGGNAKIAPSDASASRALAVAVAPSRAADGATRLLLNPQGPFTGPLSWYEARVTSQEGWNLAGGLIPGSALLLSGAGPDIGWGFSANHPDLMDVYTLEANPNDRYFYRFDGEWRRLEVREARIVVRLWGPIRFTFRREVLTSLQGPAIRNARGLFAIHYAGQDDLKGVEAFYRLNKAHDYDSFTGALASGSIPSLNFVYADKSGRIASIYNGAFPERDPAHDWTQAVAGNISSTLWKTYFPFETVPKVVAPGSGFVISANASPFQTTADPFNPKEEAFPVSMGIETRLSNRARRALALFGADRSITADDFKAYKFDGCYAPDSDVAMLVKDLGERNYAGDPLLEEAGQILRRYNLCTDKRNRGAALALLTAVPVLEASQRGLPRPNGAAVLRGFAGRFLAGFGRLDPTWGEVIRLRRGTVNLPLSGGPDALRDIEFAPRLDRTGVVPAIGGDALTVLSTWGRNGLWQVESIVPYGSSAVEGSRHYADQAPLFADGKLKPLALSDSALMAEATQIERPGKPPAQRPPVIPLVSGPAAAKTLR